ncbi:hypothetical protein ABZ128_13665 [Streptomyces sp. NPDC006326]|uniref:hypothetical protein n=1 Tax=Streptomyces sp. NPDC006326 TaxID=3156752 RepID=UPI0033A7F425
MSWQHTDLTGKSGGPPATASPAGYNWGADKSLHVVYRGVDSRVQELWFRDNQWHHSTPGSKFLEDSIPRGHAQAIVPPFTQHIVYRDGAATPHVHELTFTDGGAWKDEDLTEAAGGVPTPAPDSSPVGYMWDIHKTRHVFYRGNDNRVHELWFNGQWHKNNLTIAAGGAPLASGNPAAYTWAVDAAQHVFYRGTDRHMHELFFKAGSNQWIHVDLSLASGANPPLVGDVNPSCYTWNADRSQHVVYRGTDNHIHELWLRIDENKWHHTDVSAASGGTAPLAASNPYGYTWDVDKSQHVVYRGTDNFVHELWFRADESKWHHTALNSAAGFGVKSDRDPFGCSWDVDKGQHVVYRGTDNHLHELLFRN